MRNPRNENGENEPTTIICSESGVERLNSVYMKKFGQSPYLEYCQQNGRKKPGWRKVARLSRQPRGAQHECMQAYIGGRARKELRLLGAFAAETNQRKILFSSLPFLR